MILSIHYLCLCSLLDTSLPQWWPPQPTPYSDYHEDLSVHRVHYPLPSPSSSQCPSSTRKKRKKLHITPTMDVTDQLEKLLAHRKEMSKQRRSIPGFTIQINAGGDRERAFRWRRMIYSLDLCFSTEVHYATSSYIVRIGKFTLHTWLFKKLSLKRSFVLFHGLRKIGRRIPIKKSL